MKRLFLLLLLSANTPLALAYSGGVAQYIWLIKGYYDSVPRELEEAAAVDGATRWQAFVYVLLPLAKPILAVVFVLSFLAGMIEYPVASVLLQAEDQLTLAHCMFAIISDFEADREALIQRCDHA